jgi:octaheme c-type cytochrome (tetrathionate reductase family)
LDFLVIFSTDKGIFMSGYHSRRIGTRVVAALFGLLLTLSTGPAPADESPSSTGAATNADMNFRLQTEVSPTHHRTQSDTTADHSKFKALQGPFTSGPEVTQACLTCHTEAGHQFMKTTHWTWEYTNPKTGQKLGKRNLINNFCTNARGNEGMCAQCHAGYGWKDETFDFKNQNNIDCLACHDRSGTYYKLPPSNGNKACAVMFEGQKPINWAKVAQSVGRPGRENCGSCHFYGGGGDGVKHGDLDSSLIHANESLDVHMNEKGLNFSCTMCHVSHQHQVSGSRYNIDAKDSIGTGKPGIRREASTCESCHGTAPHPKLSIVGNKLNDHVSKIACQTCHIPAMARGGVATKIDWDWRTSGAVDKNGLGYKVDGYKQGNGEERDIYKSIKGTFKYGENLTPHYAWFNGTMNYLTIDTKFDPAKQPIAINALSGSAGDQDSRIWPFKRMHTIQPYDKGNNTLVYMHLWGNSADDKEAYWGNYNMGNAIAAGMKQFNKPYSGEFGFIQTYSYWPITHMVAPKEEALACHDCHAKNGRLKELTGFYMPGRDGGSTWLDRLGLALIALTLLGIAAHTAIRLWSRNEGDHK